MQDHRLYQGPIYVKKSPIHGYGVFAAQDIAEGQVVEESLALPYPDEIDMLANYYFIYRKSKAILFGYATLYNHSYTPNILYNGDHDQDFAVFKAARNIRKGEELFINYGSDWFSIRKIKPRANHWWRTAYHQLSGLALPVILVILGIYASVYGVRYFWK